MRAFVSRFAVSRLRHASPECTSYHRSRYLYPYEHSINIGDRNCRAIQFIVNFTSITAPPLSSTLCRTGETRSYFLSIGDPPRTATIRGAHTHTHAREQGARRDAAKVVSSPIMFGPAVSTGACDTRKISVFSREPAVQRERRVHGVFVAKSETLSRRLLSRTNGKRCDAVTRYRRLSSVAAFRRG